MIPRESFVQPVPLPEPRSLRDLLLPAADEIIRPAERIDPFEAAVKYMRVKNAYAWGNYDPKVTPYTEELLRAMMAGSPFEQVIFVGPAQAGKSNMFYAYMTYCLKVDPADLMVVEKDREAAKEQSVKKWAEFEETNGDFLEDLYKKGRSNRGIYRKQFRNGMNLTYRWPSKNQLSGHSTPRGWMPDYDRIVPKSSDEGEASTLAWQRMKTFGRRRKLIVESSPSRMPEKVMKFEPVTPHQAPPYPGILSLYNTGHMCRWLWQCRDQGCRKWFEGGFANVRWPGKEQRGISDEDRKKRPSNTVIASQCWFECPHCAAKYHHEPAKTDLKDERWRDELNSTARWVPSGITLDERGNAHGQIYNPSKVGSWWLKGGAARFSMWNELVLAYLDAYDEFIDTGNDMPLKGVMNTQWGEAYVPITAGSSLTIELLKERAQRDAGPTEGVVPEWVRYIIVTVDVQKWYFAAQAHGFGPNGRVCFLKRWNIKNSNRMKPTTDGVPNPERLRPAVFREDWDLLEQLVEMDFPLATGEGHMKPVMVLCDSGGEEGVSGNAVDFKRSWNKRFPHLSERFQLLKGEPKPDADIAEVSRPYSLNRRNRKSDLAGDVPILMVGSTKSKDYSAGRLYRPEKGPGYVDIPSWAEDWWYEEMTAEEKDPKDQKWKKIRKRNEAGDLYNYAQSANISVWVEGDKIDWDAPPAWADVWERNAFVSAEEGTQLMRNRQVVSVANDGDGSYLNAEWDDVVRSLNGET